MAQGEAEFLGGEGAFDMRAAAALEERMRQALS
jgi:hypothetical protein